MNLQQIESLRTIAKVGSFTRAAQLQRVTQSTISMRVAQLEDELGIKLFNRSTRALQLTESGREVLNYADAVHDLTASLRERLASPKVVSGTLRIGVAELIAVTWLPQMITELNQQYSKLEIDIQVGLSTQMLEKLKIGEIDICLHPVVAPLNNDFELKLLGKVKFAFLAAAAFNVPNRRLSPNDLAKWPIISLSQDSILSDVLKDWLSRATTRTIDLKHSNSMEVAAGLVRSGMGVSFLPTTYYQSDIRRGLLKELQVSRSPAHVPFYAIRARSNVEPHIARAIEIAASIGEFDG